MCPGPFDCNIISFILCKLPTQYELNYLMKRSWMVFKLQKRHDFVANKRTDRRKWMSPHPEGIACTIFFIHVLGMSWLLHSLSVMYYFICFCHLYCYPVWAIIWNLIVHFPDYFPFWSTLHPCQTWLRRVLVWTKFLFGPPNSEIHFFFQSSILGISDYLTLKYVTFNFW